MNSFDFSNQQVLVVPQEPRDRDFLLAVDRKTKGDVEARFGLMTNMDWRCNTIANQVIESIITALGFNSSANNNIKAINFFNLFSLSVSYRKTPKAEKEGNINIVFGAGSGAQKIIDDIDIPENEKEYELMPASEYFLTGLPDIDKFYENVDTFARYALSQNFSIVLADKDKYAVLGITYVFFENLFKKLVIDLKNDPDGTMQTVNFNDVIEIHARYNDQGEIVINMNPGLVAKLTIKFDAVYEGDDEY